MFRIFFMLRIGLTGGIGTGKTTVAKIFELLGVPVYNADEASKRIYHSNPGVRALLIETFGPDIYEGEQLNRQKLAAIVFNDANKLETLNRIIHPPTIRDAEEWMTKQVTPYVIKEAALLFESGSVSSLNYVIGISAPLSLRIQRVMERDKVNREQVLSRMDKQMDEEIKIRLCDFIIYNNEQELVIPQVLNLHDQLLQLASTS
jgi:dephospho-CoA kinase